MLIPIRTLSAARPLIVALALVVAGVAGASASEGYFMQAKVTRINSDGTIDVWVTSVHGLPREESAATAIDLSQLPKVFATLEFKSAGSAPRVRDSGLLGSRISLRGRCKEIDRAARVPVIQVRLKTGRRWLQANLKPVDRAGYTAFKRIAAMACASGAASAMNGMPAPSLASP